MNEWLKKLASDNGEVSSKRVVGLIGASALMLTMIVNSFTYQSVAPSDGLVNAVLVLTLGCFGFTSIEKYIKK